MHPLSRVALRSAASASRVVCRNVRTTPFASRFQQNYKVLHPLPIPFTRAFSAEPIVAKDENAEAEIDPVVKAENGEAEVLPGSAAHDQGPFETILNAQESNQETTRAPERQNLSDRPLRDGETPWGLFVRNMVFDATEDHLKEIFGKYGNIVNALIARDARGLSRGYGFVYFDNASSMNLAASNVNGSFWHGRRIMCSPRVKTERTGRKRESSEGPTSCLYIGNIPYETTDAELNRLFRDLDNVKDVRVAVDRVTGWPRGFAHADFVDVESAETAYKRLQGAVLGSRDLKIDFAAPVERGRSR